MLVKDITIRLQSNDKIIHQQPWNLYGRKSHNIIENAITWINSQKISGDQKEIVKLAESYSDMIVRDFDYIDLLEILAENPWMFKNTLENHAESEYVSPMVLIRDNFQWLLTVEIIGAL